MEKRAEIDKLIKESETTEKEKEKLLREVKIKVLKRRTMRLSIKEGSATSVMSGFGDSYIVPFAVALKSNNFQISMLTSLTGLISPIAQTFGSNLMEKNPRKKIPQCSRPHCPSIRIILNQCRL